METICLKMDEKLLNDIDKAIKNNGYSTRTEFVRDAIRSKIMEIEKEIALKNLEKYFGAGKNHRKTNLSDEEIGELAFRKLAKRHNLKLD
ncbi:MAG: ribbon-helix-helix domain-containing protein [archaeon]